METSQNIRKGMHSRIITRPEPQKYWDSFSITTSIPKDPKGVFSLPTEAMISHRTEPGMERPEQEGKTL